MIFDLNLFAAEEFGFGILTGDRVFDTTTAIVDDLLHGIFTLLPFYLCEERRKAKVVIHGPAVEGVVVALGALDPCSHENLGHVFSELHHVALGLVVVGRRDIVSTTSGREHFLNNLVEGTILGDLITKPVIPEKGGLIGHVVGVVSCRADLKKFGPFHHPKFREVFSFEKFVDQDGTLLRIFAVHESSELFFGWK